MGIEWVPIVMFVAIAVMTFFFFRYRYQAKKELQETIRTALEKGANLTPELIEQIQGPPVPVRTDLRKGVLWLGVGIAMALFGVLLGEDEAVRPFLALAAFPLLIGIGYLGLWKFGDRT